jgi:hypothetical protein
MTLSKRSFVTHHATLGDVTIIVNPRAKKMIARWRANVVQVTIPCGASKAEILGALDRLAPRLLQAKHVVSFYNGQSFNFPGLKIDITVQNLKPDSVIASISPSLETATISVGSNLNFDDTSTIATISKVMIAIAKRVSQHLIIEPAKQLAQSLGCHPAGWAISSGSHILGRCNTKGIISLSCYCVFLPIELRNYVVYHELAHLSEMNHSQRFHQLCNQYCGGREAYYTRLFRTVNWPVLR